MIPAIVSRSSEPSYTGIYSGIGIEYAAGFLNSSTTLGAKLKSNIARMRHAPPQVIVGHQAEFGMAVLILASVEFCVGAGDWAAVRHCSRH